MFATGIILNCIKLYHTDKEAHRIKEKSHQTRTTDEEKNEHVIQMQTLQSTASVDHRTMVYECPMIQPPCKNYFNTFYELHDHCEYNHNLQLRKEEEKAYRIPNTTCRRGHLGWPKCRHCGRMFKAEESRDQHMKNHDQLPYRCSVNQCGFMYNDLLSIKYHLRDVHKLSFKEVDENKYIINCCQNGSPLNAKKSNNETNRNSGSMQEKVSALQCHREQVKGQNNKESIVTVNANSGDHNGVVLERDGNLVGSVDIHVTVDGAAVLPADLNVRSDGINSKDLSPSEAINHHNCSKDSFQEEKMVCQVLLDFMENSHQNPGDDDIINNSSTSGNVSAPFREDTGKLNAENCTKGNDDEMILTDVPLNSSFEEINSLLDTDFLETFTSDVFNYTVLPAEDPGENVDAGDSKEVVTGKNTEDGNKVECTLQIASCYSLANPLNNISNDAGPHDCDVFHEHSYALPHTKSWLPSSELVGTSNVTLTAEDATPASLASDALSGLLNGVFSDFDKLPDLSLDTNNSPSTPTVDVSVDSGVDTLCSVTVDASISKEERLPDDVKELATNGDPVIGLDTGYI